MNDTGPHSVSRIRQIVSLIDLTNLNDDCDSKAIETLCAQANTPAGCVAALCVWPAFVSEVKSRLCDSTPVKIATVVNFPSGDEALNTTCEAIDMALKNGADEIDYVLPYRELINGNINHAASSIKKIRSHTPDHTQLKVILETGALEHSNLIRLAANTAIDQGADFIKTSTGKVSVNATPRAAEIMLDAISNSKKNIGFKAAGGIKTIDDANLYLKLSEERFGLEWADSSHFRFGASGLLQNVLDMLGDNSTPATDNNDY